MQKIKSFRLFGEPIKIKQRIPKSNHCLDSKRWETGYQIFLNLPKSIMAVLEKNYIA